MCAVELEDGKSEEPTKGITDLRSGVEDGGTQGHSLLFVKDREEENSLDGLVGGHRARGGAAYTREELQLSAGSLEVMKATYSCFGEPKDDTTDCQAGERVDSSRTCADHSPGDTHSTYVCCVSPGT